MRTESKELDRVFDALANEHRRDIVNALGLQPFSISQLASRRSLSLPAIHKHIRILEDAEMVVRKKIGRTNFLALNRQPLRELRQWTNGFHPYWGSGKETLENYAVHLGTDGPEKEGPP